MSLYRSVPVRARMSGRSGYLRRKRSMDGRLRRACMAIKTSQLPPVYCSSMRTRWPSALSNRNQRTAVTRLPFLEREDVVLAMQMLRARTF